MIKHFIITLWTFFKIHHKLFLNTWWTAFWKCNEQFLNTWWAFFKIHEYFLITGWLIHHSIYKLEAFCFCTPMSAHYYFSFAASICLPALSTVSVCQSRLQISVISFWDFALSCCGCRVHVRFLSQDIYVQLGA